MNASIILYLLTSCSSKEALLDTSLGEPSGEEPSEEVIEPTSEPETNEPSNEGEDLDGDGFTTADGDCDDDDASVYPNAVDFAGDGIDQDCDGEDFTDGLCNDECSFSEDGDCDDGGPNATSPLCDFGSDCSDCGSRNDLDGDGYYDDEGVSAFDEAVGDLLDCNDNDSDINPEADDIMNDGIDQDCNGEDLTELCTEECSTTGDGVCDDGGSGSDGDTCDLGTDCADCGSRIDGDSDGFDDEEDCDDVDPNINPLAEDLCNGIDEDCDGDLDEDFDETEPNDANTPYYIGSVDDGPQLISGHIAQEGDQDGFHIYTYDGTFTSPSFTCTITAPPDLNLDVTLLDTLGATADSGTTGLGGDLTIAYGGTWGDDTGNYLIIINSIEGNSCTSAYTISCQES